MAVVEQRAIGMAQRNGCKIVPAKLPELDENHAAFLGARPMPRSWRIAHIGAGGIVAAFVLEHAIQHQNFFAARMVMGGEMAAFGIADD